MSDCSSVLVIDAHVHIYDCFDRSIFFESVFSNSRRVAERLGKENHYSSVLFLTESLRENWFDRLRTHAGENGKIPGLDGPCFFSLTKESYSLSAHRNGFPPCHIISSRQIGTKEGMEVLALGTEERCPDGLSLFETVERVLERGAIPVIPWGFGKWIGKRGKVLISMLSRFAGKPVFLGDNGGRPAFLPHPPAFKLARENGIRLLSGSDPLPFPYESRRPASFGFTINGTIDPSTPGDCVKKLIQDIRTEVLPFGTPETAYLFLKNQTKMQFVKRSR